MFVISIVYNKAVYTEGTNKANKYFMEKIPENISIKNYEKDK